jgi:diaminohydroxyphosphoribosylaminopyrimidine deaminase/5-amino-6-(5-phosphoribosylamino)uracil reductase
VVYGCPDPDPRVAGQGASRLRAEGVEVVLAEGDLRRRAEELISGFASRVLRKRPEVLLKAAVSLDGQVAPLSGNSKWITGPAARARGHQLRDRADAVMVGSGTALADDPALTVRDPVPDDGRQPLRVLLDGRGRVPPSARMGGPGSLVFTGPESEPAWRDAWAAAGAEVVPVPAGPEGGVALDEVLATLGRRGLGQVMVEGGALLHGALLVAGLADRLALFQAPLLLGTAGYGWSGGWAALEVAGGPRLVGMVVERLGPDVLLEGRLAYADAEEG